MDNDAIVEDIYANIDNLSFENDYHKVQESNELLQGKITSLEKDLDNLKTELELAKKIQQDLTKNISQLYTTAKGEIERKDRQIRELRDELQELRAQKYNKSNNRFHNYEKNPRHNKEHQKYSHRSNVEDNSKYRHSEDHSKYRHGSNVEDKSRHHHEKYDRTRDSRENCSNSRSDIRARRNDERDIERKRSGSDYESSRYRSRKDFPLHENDRHSRDREIDKLQQEQKKRKYELEDVSKSNSEESSRHSDREIYGVQHVNKRRKNEPEDLSKSNSDNKIEEKKEISSTKLKTIEDPIQIESVNKNLLSTIKEKDINTEEKKDVKNTLLNKENDIKMTTDENDVKKGTLEKDATMIKETNNLEAPKLNIVAEIMKTLKETANKVKTIESGKSELTIKPNKCNDIINKDTNGINEILSPERIPQCFVMLNKMDGNIHKKIDETRENLQKLVEAEKTKLQEETSMVMDLSTKTHSLDTEQVPQDLTCKINPINRNSTPVEENNLQTVDKINSATTHLDTNILTKTNEISPKKVENSVKGIENTNTNNLNISVASVRSTPKPRRRRCTGIRITD